MNARIHFTGPIRYRLRCAAELMQAVLEVSARRAVQRPTPAELELVRGTGDTNVEAADACRFPDGRCEGSASLSGFGCDQFAGTVRGEHYAGRAGEVQGKLVCRQEHRAACTVLYFHGGGYSFYPQAYANFIALITQAAKSRTFALDYRLSPEHRFPAQLEDALNAYRWLLETGADPESLIFAGDSAGGNLALALLLAVRDRKLPLPALAVALSPPTDFESRPASALEIRLD